MYDTLIIGSGPAGMTAALYAARSNLRVGILEQGAPGGQMNNTSDIENYPGYDHISGPELSLKMYEPLEKFKVENIYGIVQRVEDCGDYKRVYTEDTHYDTKTVIVATGAKHRLLGVAGEEEYTSRGVSYCAVCDGAFFRNQELLVVGGGDSAVEEAIYLTQFAKKVTIVHRRDQLRAQKILQERAFANEKLDFIWDSVVREIQGNDIKVSNVVIENVKTGQVTNHDFGGVFIYVGLIPVTQMVSELGITNQEGWIVTDDQMKTSIPGIFAVGDVRQKQLRQITTAVGDGAIAGQGVYHHIESLSS
ncbi:TPA: thioredoxin-disulfide reductase [Streptococcus equi subsp. zooepidemicus]|uniref:thioredoxin-disulfide reductase n=1 Tax=Streptococcus equi TaxID=1336 RepID=UPI0005B789FB|nr:thioredoxin-disulfide reductase [Streptococcus equi]KIS05789.1 thioredoxin reductase [Streptococcus equi subsp. zooepidemicus Sz16]MCD3372223.1 thioredoxin-disulfide reductase [Streptococcus equi subsp. zooepidemicus]MCD3395822.1 thioredoxin-disulfide reductase [Streptococcus equi subsp. zooepidemicus]MCD3449546.1 thioredoxin-disulfide reductase [Streptococcus equi subsp. zooepidemicus]MDI5944739.1 thioredoxin-disulfide reductase [Streptococcus equi subsp. zooepidemicus]